MAAIRPTSETRVVDVGVTDSGFAEQHGLAYTHNFFEAMYPWPERITAVATAEPVRFRAAFPAVETVVADGRALPFADKAFDVAFSNAVLEHVGGRADQRGFVRELCRVAQRVFLTTPNRLFPVDPHTLLPVVHWLPRLPRERLYRALRREAGLGVELLTARSLRALFDDEVRIVNSGLTLVAIT